MKRQSRRILAFGCTFVALISGSMWRAQADGKEAKQYLDTYVSVVSKVYPPAGGVMGAMVKMLDMTGYFGKSPDPVGEALKAINSRLDDHERQINKLSTDLNELRQGYLGERNWSRFSDLQESRNNLQAIADSLAEKPTEKATKTLLVGQARAEAARFLDLEMWTWSDKSIADKDQSWTDRNDRRRTYKPGEMLEPDFKAMPTLEYYTTALVVWMATIEHASGGDTATIRSKYGAEMQKHIDWLSARPGWRDANGGDAQSLPEHIKVRVRGEYGLSKYPEQGYCYYWDLIRDDMRRGLSTSEPKRYAAEGNVLCNVPAHVRNLAPQLERQREREYGLDVMANLVNLLTNLRDKGTVKGAGVTSAPSTPSTPNPSLPNPSPSSPKVEPGGHHKAVFEENGFSTSGGKVEEQFLYGVQQDGQLIWHKHYIDHRGGKVRHTFAPTKKVGDGWLAGFKNVYPAGMNAMYSLADDGTLRWFWHTGVLDGSYRWREPSQVVGTGWNSFTQIIPMDHGVVYGILPDGTLRWHRHLNYQTGAGGTGSKAWANARVVGWGWDSKDKYFAGGNGVIYVVKGDGKLMWYRHKEYLNPPAIPASTDTNAVKLKWQYSWAEPTKVGDGWGDFTKLFSPGEGHIYGVLKNGDLMYYRHLGWPNGKYVWDESVKAKIATGWDGYAYAFARTFTSDAGSGNPEVDIVVH
jgi:hypothetical protein